ncbi:hypothetical protein Tco_0324929 [Tanacetum coccineum]
MPNLSRAPFSQDLDLLEQHLTKDIISRTDCTTTLTNLRTKFENAFNSKFEEHMRKYTRYNAQSFNDAMIFVKQNSCSEKEDSNSETTSSKSAKECSLNSETQDVHAITYKMSKAKERCMPLSITFIHPSSSFKRRLKRIMLLNVDQLQKQLDKDEFHEDGSMTAFWVNRGSTLQRYTTPTPSKIDTGKALDADLVDTKSIRTYSTVQDDNSRSGNDTDADDADIKPIYDKKPMAEVQLTAECNIFAIGQQHTEQPEIIVEGRVDQYPETCQVKSPMLDSSPDNQTTEYSKQSLESENILLKKTVAQFQKDFSRMEAHSKIKKEIDVLEIMHIELEHSVAKLRKENETLKQHYKDLYDSVKITRTKTTEQTTSLLANNSELKTQIQEKVFAIAALKNYLRKLKGNSVDTKFDKTSV